MVLLMRPPETYGFMMVLFGPMLATYKAHKEQPARLEPQVPQEPLVLQVMQVLLDPKAK
jgi:hypothetical protein